MRNVALPSEACILDTSQDHPAAAGYIWMYVAFAVGGLSLLYMQRSVSVISLMLPGCLLAVMPGAICGAPYAVAWQ